MHDGLVLRDVALVRDGCTLLRLDRHIAPGAVLTLMGPSGSGKSTLLALLTGALPPEFSASGRVLLNGRDVTDAPAHQRRMGLLFQDDLLFAHMNVGQNLAFGLAPGGTRAARRARVEEALREIGLPGYAARDPATLSGGQRARVALMRMMLAEPEAMLLDEPFSRLDATLRGQIRRLVFGRARARRLPVLLVTHDEEDARAAGGEIVRLDAGPGPCP